VVLWLNVTGTEYCAKKPSNISFAEAASAPLAGLTALQCLRILGTKEGSRVFISSGAGGWCWFSCYPTS